MENKILSTIHYNGQSNIAKNSIISDKSSLLINKKYHAVPEETGNIGWIKSLFCCYGGKSELHEPVTRERPPISSNSIKKSRGGSIKVEQQKVENNIKPNLKSNDETTARALFNNLFPMIGSGQPSMDDSKEVKEIHYCRDRCLPLFLAIKPDPNNQVVMSPEEIEADCKAYLQSETLWSVSSYHQSGLENFRDAMVCLKKQGYDILNKELKDCIFPLVSAYHSAGYISQVGLTGILLR